MLMLTAILCLPPTAETAVPVHSHNDYWRSRPLEEALEAGCLSIEADVLIRGGELLVGHGPGEVTDERTLTSMYLSPLADIVRARNRVYPQDHRPLILLVDLKTEWDSSKSTLEAVIQNFADILKARPAFHQGEGGVLLAVSGSGGRPKRCPLRHRRTGQRTWQSAFLFRKINDQPIIPQPLPMVWAGNTGPRAANQASLTFQAGQRGRSPASIVGNPGYAGSLEDSSRLWCRPHQHRPTHQSESCKICARTLGQPVEKASGKSELQYAPPPRIQTRRTGSVDIQIRGEFHVILRSNSLSSAEVGCLELLHASYKTQRAFTIIELLVVIAVIGVLSAILLPAIGTARNNAKTTTASSNLRQIGTAVAKYQNQNKDRFIDNKYNLSSGHTRQEGKRQSGIEILPQTNAAPEALNCSKSLGLQISTRSRLLGPAFG